MKTQTNQKNQKHNTFLNMKLHYKLLLLIVIIFITISIFNIIISRNNVIKKYIPEKFDIIDSSTNNTQSLPSTTQYIMPTVQNTISISKNSSTELNIITQIASLLNITNRRIQNLTYASSIINGQLDVSFDIAEPNFIESHTSSISTTDAIQTLNALIATHKFLITINGSQALVNKTSIPQVNRGDINISDMQNNANSTTPTNLEELSRYFNNNSLLTVADYAKNIYDTVPNDSSVSRFYKLSIDTSNNIHIDSPPSL